MKSKDIIHKWITEEIPQLNFRKFRTCEKCGCSEEVLEEEPILTAEDLKAWDWCARESCCSCKSKWIGKRTDCPICKVSFTD